jgi:preprotein translocase subunit SecD
MQTHKILLGVALLLLAAGCGTFGGHKPMTLQICEQVDNTLPEGHWREVQIPKTELTLRIDTTPVLTGRDVTEAQPFETSGGLAVMLHFNAHGMFALDEVTTRNRGRYLVVFLNDRPVAARLVDQRLVHGQFLLEGDFTDAEARQLIDDLNQMARKRG